MKILSRKELKLLKKEDFQDNQWCQDLCEKSEDDYEYCLKYSITKYIKGLQLKIIVQKIVTILGYNLKYIFFGSRWFERGNQWCHAS